MKESLLVAEVNLLLFLWHACHIKFFVVFLLQSILLNLGIEGKYHKIFVGTCFFLISLEFLLIFHLNIPHVGYTAAYEYSFLYKMQSLGLACIFSYSTPNEPNVFFASYKVEGILFFSVNNSCRNFNSHEKLP